jgi:hypothetical protein
MRDALATVKRLRLRSQGATTAMRFTKRSPPWGELTDRAVGPPGDRSRPNPPNLAPLGTKPAPTTPSSVRPGRAFSLVDRAPPGGIEPPTRGLVSRVRRSAPCL